MDTYMTGMDKRRRNDRLDDAIDELAEIRRMQFLRKEIRDRHDEVIAIIRSVQRDELGVAA